MAEIKHTFTGGKMNKDLDERLLKNGEYRDALNVQVRTTVGAESDGVGDSGTVQNLEGTKQVAASYYQNWMDLSISSDLYSTEDPIDTGIKKDYLPRCVASVADEKNDRAFFFFASTPFDKNGWWKTFSDPEPRFFVDTIIESPVNANDSYVFVDCYAIVGLVGPNDSWGMMESFGNNNPYLNTGWSEIKVTAGTGNLYKPGMNIRILNSTGVNILENNATIKAIDGDTILLFESQYTYLNPSNVFYIEFTAPRVLDFRHTLSEVASYSDFIGNQNGYITGVNVIDDFIIWTDGYGEPKKISISRSKAGTNINGVANDGKTHTKLYVDDPDSVDLTAMVSVDKLMHKLDNGGIDNGSGVDDNIKEKHITVLRQAPRSAPTIHMRENDRQGLTNTEVDDEASSGDFTVGVGGSLTIGSIKRFAITSSNTEFRANDILEFLNYEDCSESIIIKAKFICYEDSDGNEVFEPTLFIRVSVMTIPDNFYQCGNLTNWEISLEQRKPLFELKLSRFAYRYKYEDGEYSAFSPWSEVAFLPGDFDYKISEAYNLGMVNHCRELIIKDFIPYTIPEDVKSVDILYKTTDSPDVYVVDSIDRGTSPEWELFTPNGQDSTEIKTGELHITSEMIHRVLPSNQTLRAWDNVPRVALSQEIVGNRIVYGNYTQGYNLSKVSLIQNVLSEPIDITEDSQPANKSIKSIRDYKVGMVFGDKYGRETPVISSGYIFTSDSTIDDYTAITGDVNVEKTLCANKNSLVVSQQWGDNGPDSWIDYVKYYVKETSNEYYNLIMDRWYDSGDGTTWLSFNSADRNKVDEETYLILKNKYGTQDPVLEKARYKIIAITGDAPDYIKSSHRILGTVGAPSNPDNDLDLDGDGALDTPLAVANAWAAGGPNWGYGLGPWSTFDSIWDTGQLPNTAVADGFVNGTTLKLDIGMWQTQIGGFDPALGQNPFNAIQDTNREMGDIYIRIVGKSWSSADLDNDGSDEVNNNIIYQRKTGWKLVTNVYYDSTLPAVIINWSEPFGNEADFFTIWSQATVNDAADPSNPINVDDLTYEVEFKEVVVKNKPEFDGKFFVKVKTDSTLRSSVMTYTLGYNWTQSATYQLSYVDSGSENQGGTIQAGVTANMLASDIGTWYGGLFSAALSTYDPSSGFTQIEDIDWWNNGVKPYCGAGDSGPWPNGGVTTWMANDSWNLTAAMWLFDGMGISYGTEGEWASCDECTSLGTGDGDWDNNYYRDSYDTSIPNFENFYNDNWGGEVSWWENPAAIAMNNSTGENTFAQLANKGVFGSGTYYYNERTSIFWDHYSRGEDGLTGAAFIDSAKARYFNTLTAPSIFGGEEPHYYKPFGIRASSSDVFEGDIDEMVLSAVKKPDGTYEPGSIGALEALCGGSLSSPEGGVFFSWGSDANIYEVIGAPVVVTSSNTSYGNIRGFDYFAQSTSGNVVPGETSASYPFTSPNNNSGFNTPNFYLTESCVPCDDPREKSEQYILDNWDIYAESANIATNGNIELYPIQLSGQGDQNFNMRDFHLKGCQRKSIIFRFRKIDQVSGQILPNGEALTPTTYDPRGALHHDGRDSIELRIMSPSLETYADEDPTNELGACWETEPKKDTDLDIYYEASNALPVRLNKTNAFDYAPINASIGVQRPNDDGFQNINLSSNRKNHKVTNLYFSGDASNQVIVAIESANGISGTTSLHTGPYDIDGDYDQTMGVSFIDIQVGDILVFTHNDGTKTKATVKNYWIPIDDSPDGDFNNLETNEFDSNAQPQYTQLITSGPKSFEITASSYPTGYYGIDIEVFNLDVQLPWFNCYAFGNGVESDRVRDDFNAPQMDNGVKVSTTFSGYGKEHIGSGLIYSGLYNSTSQINNLNEFNMAEKITKELNPRFGSIQRLRARDTDMVVFAEDKVLKLLANKDAVFNADGNPQLTATDRVLGTPIPFVGDYGISKNPESLAWDQYRMYFTDKQRSAVLRLSRDGLTPISNVGMRSWFRHMFGISKGAGALGTFDTINGEYNLTFEEISSTGVGTTISFNESTKGWVSFKSFVPSSGLSVSGTYLTSYKNKVWQHYDSDSGRNTFYDQDFAPSRLTFIFNSGPGNVKSFKTVNYEGSQAKITQFVGTNKIAYTNEPLYNSDNTSIIGSGTALVNLTDNEYSNLASAKGWYATTFKTDLSSGSVLEFKEKEGKWFNHIVGDDRPIHQDVFIETDNNGQLQTTASSGFLDTGEFTIQGIGQVSDVEYISVNPENDCIPPCPSDMECVPCSEDPDGCCVPITPDVYGCMDPMAANYNSLATISDGSCLYNITGCLDPMNPSYDPNANQTFDTSDGTIGDTFDSSCYPFCVDCPQFVYGCEDSTASNYNPAANNDGECSYQGTPVPCPQVLVTDTSSPSYNGNIWTDAGFSEDEIGLYDSFNYIFAFSCSYCTECCPDGEILNSDGNCVAEVLGCTDPDFTQYNPAANVDDGSCEELVISVPGCTEVDACNYNPSATYDNGTCEYYSCQGCMDPTACNYNPDATVDDGTCCEICEQDECVDVVPGCLDEFYQEYCGPGNVYGIDPPCNTSCGGYPEAMCGMLPGGGFLGPCSTPESGVYGCMDETANNYNENATVDDGSCTFTFFGCTDPTSSNYYLLDYPGQGLPAIYTIIEDDGSCEYLYGCTNPEASNFVGLEADGYIDDGSCIPFIYGCMDPTAVNYNANATISSAGNNDWTEWNGGYFASYSNVYDGQCIYWQYGCTDPAAINYNEFNNTMVNMVWTSQASQPWYMGNGGVWDPGTGNGSIPTAESNDNGPLPSVWGNGGETFFSNCDTCNCEYPSIDNMRLDVENYIGDTNEPDYLYQEGNYEDFDED